MKPTWIRRGNRGVRRGVELLARYEPIRRVLFEYYDKKSKRSMRLAPVLAFDKQYGIRTSGALPGFVLGLDYPLKETTARVGYVGVQPTILRRVLNVLPQHDGATFIDLGCGKGRALVVASEFPFRSIIGVELTPELAEIAQENARVISRDFPERPPITVIHANALEYSLPAGPLIIFLFNPFEEELITNLLGKIESALAERDSSLWVVYLNPVCGNIFDTSSMLRRIYADEIPYDPEETGSVPHSSETVIIWQDTKTAGSDTPKGVDRRIVVTAFGLRADLAE